MISDGMKKLIEQHAYAFSLHQGSDEAQQALIAAIEKPKQERDDATALYVATCHENDAYRLSLMKALDSVHRDAGLGSKIRAYYEKHGQLPPVLRFPGDQHTLPGSIGHYFAFGSLDEAIEAASKEKS